MPDTPDSHTLVYLVILLGAAVLTVLLFKRLGLGSVLGYLCAGLVVGPFGLKLFTNPDAILHVAELGVVMFLFIIGIEMQPSRLWRMRKDIFGLGIVQAVLCGLLLTGGAVIFAVPIVIAFIGAMGFVLSSTAIVMQILEERGEVNAPRSQRIMSTLLFEDLLIVPLLAVVALLSPISSGEAFNWVKVIIALGSVITLIAAGIWLLNPFFALLASAQAREIMTAAALLVVLGAALLMQLSGLSMAMGAFLAGVLLSESSFRRQLEIDIEPFRGILLGLFFMAVGMSLNVDLVIDNWPLIALTVTLCMVLKACGVYGAARLFGIKKQEALQRSILLSHGGEFAFVLYASALAAGIFDARVAAVLSATVVLSMALTPVVMMVKQAIPPSFKEMLPEDVEQPDGLSSKILLIGFGRFGQIASQSLLALGFDPSIIESDAKRIRSAADFGFKVYYGDGTRLDVLKASGAEEACLILVCVANVSDTNKIVKLVKEEFPTTKVFARAYDRLHAIDLMKAGADYQIRETFESALAFSQEALLHLGVEEDEAVRLTQDMRQRDQERLEMQVTAGISAGADLRYSNTPKPTPLTKPQREGQIIDQSELTTAPENSA